MIFSENADYHAVFLIAEFFHVPVVGYYFDTGLSACGLDASYLNIGKSVVIPHTCSIDSLNLSVAAGIISGPIPWRAFCARRKESPPVRFC